MKIIWLSPSFLDVASTGSDHESYLQTIPLNWSYAPDFLSMVAEEQHMFDSFWVLPTTTADWVRFRTPYLDPLISW